MRALSLAARALRREWRAGELRVLALALVVAVGAVTSVGAFSDRVRQALERRATDLLAADLVVSSPSAPDPGWRVEAERRGLRGEEVLEFRSVALAGERSQLVEVKAVGAAYPLRGALRASAERFGAATRRQAPPAAGTVWVDGQLLDALQLPVGGEIELGDARLRIAGVVRHEPDRVTGTLGIAPRVLMRVEDLAASGLVLPGSRVRYRLLVAGAEPPLQAFRDWLAPRLEPGQRFRDVREARPEIGRALERGERFLSLAALTAVLLGGVAIAIAARRHAERQADNSALLRCFGASQRLVASIYGLKLLSLGLAASLAGCLLGYLGQAGIVVLLGGLLQTELPAASLRPVLGGLAIGLATLLGFALPPILRLRRVPPMRVLRRDLGPPPLSQAGLYGLGAAVMVALMAWTSADVRLTAWLVLGTAGTLAALAGGAWLLVRALAPLRRRVGVALRFGLAAVARRRAASTVQVMAFGVGLMAVLLLTVIRGDLLGAWRERIPAGAPNHFLINIQPSQAQSLIDWLAGRGLPDAQVLPMVRARLVTINGRPADQWGRLDDVGQHRLEHGFNLSWAATMQADNRLLAGEWWPERSRGERLLSIEQGMAGHLGVGLGDRLGFRIGDRSAELEVVNIREVEWDNFRVNFFVVVAPGVLEDFPATYLSSIHLRPEQKPMLNELVRAFPSVTLFDVEDILQQVQGVIDQVARAVEFVFGFTVAAGLMVLYAALQSSLEERRQEGALLRALGARRGHLRLGLLGEYTTLGLLAGVLGAVAAAAVGWVLAEQVLNLAYRPDPAVLAIGGFGGALTLGLAGLLGTGSVIRQPPLAVLRTG